MPIRVQQGGMTRMLIIRSIKFLTPLFTFKDGFVAKKAIKVLHQGPCEVAVRVLKLQKQPKPRVMLSIVEDAGLVVSLQFFGRSEGGLQNEDAA